MELAPLFLMKSTAGAGIVDGAQIESGFERIVLKSGRTHNDSGPEIRRFSRT
jgi:hypothetical protein